MMEQRTEEALAAFGQAVTLNPGARVRSKAGFV
jgi:hypothetical protein